MPNTIAVIICGYYGWQDWEGMNYCSLIQKVLEDREIPFASLVDITDGSSDPEDGRRVWSVALNAAGINALEEMPDLFEFVEQ